MALGWGCFGPLSFDQAPWSGRMAMWPGPNSPRAPLAWLSSWFLAPGRVGCQVAYVAPPSDRGLAPKNAPHAI
jgi:hypothetical protein